MVSIVLFCIVLYHITFYYIIRIVFYCVVLHRILYLISRIVVEIFDHDVLLSCPRIIVIYSFILVPFFFLVSTFPGPLLVFFPQR